MAQLLGTVWLSMQDCQNKPACIPLAGKLFSAAAETSGLVSQSKAGRQCFWLCVCKLLLLWAVVHACMTYTCCSMPLCRPALSYTCCTMPLVCITHSVTTLITHKVPTQCCLAYGFGIGSILGQRTQWQSRVARDKSNCAHSILNLPN